MRKRTEKALETYRDIAKAKLSLPDNDDQIETVLDWHTTQLANASETSQESQQEIFALQEEKQKIMAELTEQIKGLDRREALEMSPNQRQVQFKDGKLIVSSRYHDDMEISLGELMTDSEWGIDYFLDPQSVPRSVRKRFLIEQAKSKIASLLDEQILIEEIESEKVEQGKKRAYRAYKEAKEKDFAQLGFLAERMVQNIFKKIFFNHKAPFTVQGADVYQDVEQKVDFIIKKRHHFRGVGVEEEENKDSVGFQFTVNKKPMLLRRKDRQIAKVKSRLDDEDFIEDIVLVIMPSADIQSAYKRWKRGRKAPGGPDKLLRRETKEVIFKNVLSRMIEEEDLNKFWEEIKDKI